MIHDFVRCNRVSMSELVPASDGNVEEFLKSARSVYLVLVGVCAAIALFAASPREVERYISAKNDLHAVRAINFAVFLEYERGLVAAEASKYYG